MEQHERRYLTADSIDGLELEQRDNEPTKLRGIAPPWNSLSVDLGGFREQFAPSAFDHLLDRSKNDPRPRPDVVGLFNHDESQLLARTTNGTLTLAKHERGLAWEMTGLPDTQAAKDVVALVRAGLVSGASFAFAVNERGEHWTQDEKGNAIRTITSANLFDVSIVTRPAYPQSSAALRSLERWRQENLTAAEVSQAVERQRDQEADRRRRLADAVASSKQLRLKAYGQ